MLKPKAKQKPKKSRQEINEESRALKRKRKHKGFPSGHRFNKNENSKSKNEAIVKDPRIGSKKPISLTTDEKVSQIQNKVSLPKATTKVLSPEQELESLENDTLLESLLDLIEQNQKLSDDQQNYVNSKLNRIEELMDILGYEYDEPEQEDEQQDIMHLLKHK